MSQPAPFQFPILPQRLRGRWGRRMASLLLALLVEGLLLLALLTLAPEIAPRREVVMKVFGISPEPEAEQAATAEEQAEPEAADARPQVARPQPPETPPPLPEPPPARLRVPFIPLTPDEMAAADIAPSPSRADPSPRTRATIGPPAPARSGDTPRVDGTGPNGEPLYAASWYREPYDSELSGYLSTASGPGWGLIACRTVQGFRVEDCVGIAEYPQGSNIMRSVLAAAWQFRVRPPQIGGQPKFGEWVRIKIDYNLRREGR